MRQSEKGWRLAPRWRPTIHQPLPANVIGLLGGSVVVIDVDSNKGAVSKVGCPERTRNRILDNAFINAFGRLSHNLQRFADTGRAGLKLATRNRPTN